MNETVFKKRLVRAIIVCSIVLLAGVLVVVCPWNTSGIFADDSQDNDAVLAGSDESAPRVEVGGNAGRVGLDAEQTSYVQTLWQEISNGQSEQQALSTLGFEAFISGDNDIPYWFQVEIADLPQDARLVMNSTGSLVGILIHGDMDSAKDYVSDQLIKRGWKQLNVSDGQEKTQGAYIKEEGDCRWITISMLQTGEETSVVLHIQHA